MFCGGVFAFLPDGDDIFIVADGQEMSQHDLLNICRGSMSILINSPLDQHSKKVLFVEAASTLLCQYNKYIIGVATYHQQSIPLLSEIMARILTLLKTQFASELVLTNHHTRSLLFHTIKHLLGDDLGIKAGQNVKLLNIPETVTLNPTVSYKLLPSIDGQFFVADQNEEAFTEPVSTTLDSMANGLYGQYPSISEESETGTCDLLIEEEVTFEAAGETVTESDVVVKISATTQSKSDLGGLMLKLPPQPPTINVRPNPQCIQEMGGCYVCPNPTKELQEPVLVLYITGTDNRPQQTPFLVDTIIQQNETHAKITVTIRADHEVDSVVIGVEGEGIDPDEVVSQDSDVANASDTKFILRPKETIPSNGGEITASFFGPLRSRFVPPTSVSIQCKLPNYIQGEFRPEMKPGSNFITGKVARSTFVQNSTWAIQ